MKIFVFIPAFNAEKTLEKTLLSLLNQTYPVTPIVINDYSTDKTAIIARKMGVEVIENKKNVGCYNSINHGLFVKKGKFDAWSIHGSDDVSTINRFEIHKEAFDKGYLSSIAKFTRINYDNQILSKPIHCSSTTCFSSKIFNELGYYDNTRFGGDTEYYHRVRKYIGNIAIININLLMAYTNEKNITSTVSNDKRKIYWDNFLLENIKHKEWIRQ